MGGLVILESFERWYGSDDGRGRGAALPPGRIVLLGAPVRAASRRDTSRNGHSGAASWGLTAHEVLLPERDRRWPGKRDLGVIAGNVPVGLGRFMGPFSAPSDGTVLVQETHLSGAKEYLVLRTTHSGMVYSPLVARQTAIFLRNGHFEVETRR